MEDYKHIFLEDGGTRKGKEDTQNGIVGTIPGIIWIVRYGGIIFVSRIGNLCLRYLKIPDTVWNYLMYVGNRYIGCIYRDTCTTLSYIRRIIFGGDENCDLSLPMKNSSEPASAMPGHALLLAMDDFFHRIVNFFEQSFVRKVAVVNFATIAERQIALP